MGKLVSPGRDRRKRILDCFENRKVRWDVYTYGSGEEHICRDMIGCVHFGEDTWNRYIRYGQITSYYIPYRTKIPQATNPNFSSKRKSSDNKKPEDWKPYAQAYLDWEARQNA